MVCSFGCLICVVFKLARVFEVSGSVDFTGLRLPGIASLYYLFPVAGSVDFSRLRLPGISTLPIYTPYYVHFLQGYNFRFICAFHDNNC